MDLEIEKIFDSFDKDTIFKDKALLQTNYKPEEIPKLLSEIEKGYDLVLGSRFKGEIESMTLIKRLGNKVFSRVISNITRMKISDGQTGFRAFTKEVAEK